MEYLTTYLKYQVYKNSEGFLELYCDTRSKEERKIKGTNAKNINRIVTNVKDVGQLEAFLSKSSTNLKKYNPYNDPNQLKIE